jgi:hypothetical protein
LNIGILFCQGRCWKKNYFSEDMWRSKEFNAKVIAGSTWIDDIIEIKEVGARLLIIDFRLLTERTAHPNVLRANGHPPLVHLARTARENTSRGKVPSWAGHAGEGGSSRRPADSGSFVCRHLTISSDSLQNTNERLNAGHEIRPPVQRGLTAVDEGPVDGESVANLSFESNVAVVGRRTVRSCID